MTAPASQSQSFNSGDWQVGCEECGKGAVKESGNELDRAIIELWDFEGNPNSDAYEELIASRNGGVAN